MTCVLLLDMFFTAADLSRLRRCLDDVARLAGLAEPRRGEFVLAVHEVTGNAIQHGGGRGRARLWYADGTLRCRVTDDGPGLTDAAIPAALPAPDFGEDGRGLWLARELSDRLHITGGEGSAIVTLEFDLVVMRRDRPGRAPAAAPAGQAMR
jgi:anti-sigma regulatory factor (Ser/Thr protein kinase)